MGSVSKILLMTSFVTACAALQDAGVREEMDVWIGRTEAELFRSYGSPQEQRQDVNGEKVYIFDESRSTATVTTISEIRWQRRGTSTSNVVRWFAKHVESAEAKDRDSVAGQVLASLGVEYQRVKVEIKN